MLVSRSSRTALLKACEHYQRFGNTVWRRLVSNNFQSSRVMIESKAIPKSTKPISTIVVPPFNFIGAINGVLRNC
eukprot:CCRYP_010219-RA/>CCRYP_010219-RA protein AED:0.02 eAED:0.02 QI:1096/1/1/1/0/0/3/2418/74